MRCRRPCGPTPLTRAADLNEGLAYEKNGEYTKAFECFRTSKEKQNLEGASTAGPKCDIAFAVTLRACRSVQARSVLRERAWGEGRPERSGEALHGGSVQRPRSEYVDAARFALTPPPSANVTTATGELHVKESQSLAPFWR